MGEDKYDVESITSEVRQMAKDIEEYLDIEDIDDTEDCINDVGLINDGCRQKNTYGGHFSKFNDDEWN